LDAACGTGRRVSGPHATRHGRRASVSGSADLPGRAVGVDLVHAMLAAGRRARPDGPAVACADLRALPFADRRFDVVWCRLALGHLGTLGTAYRELGRVCRRGGCVVVSDFHPEAAKTGHTRTFRDARGRLREVEHFVHAAADHRAAARAAGLTLDDRVDASVGPEVRPIYERAKALDRYRIHRGLPLVLALRFSRPASGADESPHLNAAGRAEG
ncbi:MAG: class I SAM-dependent methyltransferase, partial [Gemmatimonadota bacterium]